MKKIIQIGLMAFLLLFLIGATGCEKKGDLLEVKLYDANKNPIMSTSGLFAIVGEVPDVKFIEIRTTVANTGNIDLRESRLFLTVPSEIMDGFVQQNDLLPYDIGYNVARCNKGDITGIGLPSDSCGKYPLNQGDIFTFSSGLVDVDKIGYGTHNLVVVAEGLYDFSESTSEVMICCKTNIFSFTTKEECEGVWSYPSFCDRPTDIKTGFTEKVSDGVTLIIERDPIKASVSVDITTGEDVTIVCPEGTIYNVETGVCVSIPIPGGI